MISPDILEILYKQTCNHHDTTFTLLWSPDNFAKTQFSLKWLDRLFVCEYLEKKNSLGCCEGGFKILVIQAQFIQ